MLNLHDDEDRARALEQLALLEARPKRELALLLMHLRFSCLAGDGLMREIDLRARADAMLLQCQALGDKWRKADEEASAALQTRPWDEYLRLRNAADEVFAHQEKADKQWHALMGQLRKLTTRGGR